MSRPGHTNNPAGRTPGRGMLGQLRNEMLTGERLTKLVNKVYEQAIGGDMIAARLLLDRVVPALRPQAQRQAFALPNGTPTAQAQALLAAAAAGELPADVASDLITAIGRVMGIAEGDELRRRLDAQEFGDIA